MGEIPYERQSDAEAAASSFQRTVALCEQVENLGLQLRGDADSGVADPDAHLIRMLGSFTEGLGNDVDMSTRRGKFYGVVQDIDEHLGQPDRIGTQHHCLARQ